MMTRIAPQIKGGVGRRGSLAAPFLLVFCCAEGYQKVDIMRSVPGLRSAQAVLFARRNCNGFTAQ
jgi:hypothetical protein